MDYANSLPFSVSQEHGSPPAETPDMIVFLFLLYTLIPAIGIMISCTNTFFSFTPPIQSNTCSKAVALSGDGGSPANPPAARLCLATSRHLPTSHQHHDLSRLSRPIYLPNFSRKSIPLNSQPLGDRLNHPLAGRGGQPQPQKLQRRDECRASTRPPTTTTATGFRFRFRFRCEPWEMESEVMETGQQFWDGALSSAWLWLWWWC